MSAVVGLGLGIGILLLASPFVWPERSRAAAALSRRAGGGRLRSTLALAGLSRVPVSVLVVVTLIAAVVAGALVLAVTALPVLAGLAALFALAVPVLVVRSRAAARRRTFSAAWPDLVDHLVAAVRSGRSLGEALAGLAEAGPEGMRPAFRAFARDYRRSADFGGAVLRLKEALGDPAADRILETVRLAREVGGADVTLVLRQVSLSLREDLAARSEAEARQSWVTYAARIGVAAPWLVLGLLATRPETAAAYDSPGGLVLIVGGAALSVVAYRAMVALGRLPEEGRWFR
jgi:tight adherence protein B